MAAKKFEFVFKPPPIIIFKEYEEVEKLNIEN